MTYRQLKEKLEKMNDCQLDCNLTVELGIENKCLSAELRICGKNHDWLDEDHPVIYIQDLFQDL